MARSRPRRLPDDLVRPDGQPAPRHRRTRDPPLRPPDGHAGLPRDVLPLRQGQRIRSRAQVPHHADGDDPHGDLSVLGDRKARVLCRCSGQRRERVRYVRCGLPKAGKANCLRTVTRGEAAKLAYHSYFWVLDQSFHQGLPIPGNTVAVTFDPKVADKTNRKTYVDGVLSGTDEAAGYNLSDEPQYIRRTLGVSESLDGELYAIAFYAEALGRMDDVPKAHEALVTAG
ncbi:hypothetical protein DFJ74DRAFT_652998 [Hyaloraphidium curvatum]|nr:hypothetical protein DFJ74DRAFT_652998 [Hyaloraphidium curvatum]